jgi:hypothetical protein
MAKRYPPSIGRRRADAAGQDDVWPERLSLREAVLKVLEPTEREELIGLQGEAYMVYATMSPSPRGRRYLDLCAKGWAKLQPHLVSSELLGTGQDPRDPFGPRRPIPAERWPHATLNFEKWTVGIGGLTIVEVEITWGGLQIFVAFRRARLGPLDLELSPRSFDLLLMLAEGAMKGEPMVTLDQLKDRLLTKDHGEKALGQAIGRLRDDLERSGVTSRTVDKLIANVRGEGYRLNLPAAHISILTGGLD